MIYYVLFAHWLNDFVGQNYLFPTVEVGKNKSKDWSILWLHIILYTIGMCAMMAPFMTLEQLTAFGLINGSSHFVIDAVTSRVSGWAYTRGDHRMFWSVIGLDQFLHVAILCATL
jgi:hypothetical protein